MKLHGTRQRVSDTMESLDQHDRTRKTIVGMMIDFVVLSLCVEFGLCERFLFCFVKKKIEAGKKQTFLSSNQIVRGHSEVFNVQEEAFFTLSGSGCLLFLMLVLPFYEV